MPARSEAQRKLIYARFGVAFARKHHFDNPGKLPAKVGPVTKALAKRR